MSSREYTSFTTHLGDVYHGYFNTTLPNVEYITLHRTDGPAIIDAKGELTWYVDSIGYADIYEWAKAALIYEGNKNPSSEEISEHVQQTLAKLITE